MDCGVGDRAGSVFAPTEEECERAADDEELSCVVYWSYLAGVVLCFGREVNFCGSVCKFDWLDVVEAPGPCVCWDDSVEIELADARTVPRCFLLALSTICSVRERKLDFSGSTCSDTDLERVSERGNENARVQRSCEFQTLVLASQVEDDESGAFELVEAHPGVLAFDGTENEWASAEALSWYGDAQVVVRETESVSGSPPTGSAWVQRPEW